MANKQEKEERTHDGYVFSKWGGKRSVGEALLRNQGK